TVPKILHEPVQPSSRANIANSLNDLLYPPYIATSVPVGLLGRHSVPNLLGRQQFHVSLEFLIEIAIKELSAEYTVPKRAESTDHRAPYVVRKAVAMARDIRSHRS